MSPITYIRFTVFAPILGALLVFLASTTPAATQSELGTAVFASRRLPRQSASAAARTAPAIKAGEHVAASRAEPVEPAEGQANRSIDLGPKHIEVNLSTQRVIAWEGDSRILDFPATTGDEGSPTVLGDYTIADKIESDAYSDLWGMSMPFWMGIYDVGDWEDGFHGLPTLDDGEVVWGDAVGKYPATHGCIVLSLEDANTLFSWAEVGTPVEVHD